MKLETENINYRLIAEFIILFILLPLIYASGLLEMSMLSLLMLAAFYCFIVLMFDPASPKEQLWSRKPNLKVLKKMAIMFAVLAPALLLSVYLFAPEKLFSMLSEKPRVLLLIVILYPFISVYPQELVYRCFFFYRYKSFFKNEKTAILTNAVLFAYMHIVFNNWVAVALSLAGGFIFAHTYKKTKSLFWVSVEHCLYGLLVFVAGLGGYFLGGTTIVGSLLSK